MLLDRDESALHPVQLSIDGRGLLDTDDLVVADIRDRDRIDEVFDRFGPRSCSTPPPSSTSRCWSASPARP